MKIPIDEKKYLSKWKYVEIAKYVPSLDKVIRQKHSGVSTLISVDSLESFRDENSNIGLYTSIWHFDSQNIDESIRLGSLYFDIDNKDLEKSYSECIKLYSYLLKHIPSESVLVYFTGKKGFHIECEAIALGINPSNNLPNIFRYIASSLAKSLKLESLDFSVYDARRMWRLPGSQHQSTGLYKNLLPENILLNGPQDILDFCKERKDNLVEDQEFNFKANEWFRNFTYELEIEKERSKDFVSYFNKHGSSAFKDVDEKDKQFTKDRLLENCSAIKRLYDQAVEKKWLDHESRLFLCSILTYTEDSIDFLHEILSNCEDYNVEKSSSHIRDWVKRRQLGIGGRPYTCERANSAGVGCGQCQLDKKKKWIKIGNKYVESDEVSSPSPVRFAYVSVNKGGENV